MEEGIIIIFIHPIHFKQLFYSSSSSSFYDGCDQTTAISSSTGNEVKWQPSSVVYAFEFAVHLRVKAIVVATHAFVEEALQSWKNCKKCKKLQKIVCLAFVGCFVVVPLPQLCATSSPFVLWLIADLKNNGTNQQIESRLRNQFEDLVLSCFFF